MGFDPARVIPDFGDAMGEARACRTGVALFDFSFMARGMVSGPNAPSVLTQLTPRDLTDLAVGRIRYALRESATGQAVADLTFWRVDHDVWEMMSGRHEDIDDLSRIASGLDGVVARDLTPDTRIFAVQGPGTIDALCTMLSPDDFTRVRRLVYFESAVIRLAGVDVRVGRLGYTGEQGVELVVPAVAGGQIWAQLAAVARPAGFVAADMLRIEAGFVLFANEFRLPVTAGEAGLGRFSRITARPLRKPELHLVAFRAEASERVELFQPAGLLQRPAADDAIVVTSACRSLLAESVLGLGYIRRTRAAGRPLHDPAGVFRSIRVVERPFHDPGKRRPRAPW